MGGSTVLSAPWPDAVYVQPGFVYIGVWLQGVRQLGDPDKRVIRSLPGCLIFYARDVRIA